MEYPNSLKNLIESLKKLPTIGEKSAERLAFAILSMDEEDANLFSESIMDVKKKIKKCKVCGNITEKEVCNICESDERDSKTICVVEDSKNIISLENDKSKIEEKIADNTYLQSMYQQLSQYATLYDKDYLTLVDTWKGMIS